MRRGFVVVLLVAFGFASVFSVGGPGARAQEGTPPAAQAGELPEGVDGRVVASGWVQVLSPGRATLDLGRISLAPGAALPLDADDPAAALVLIVSGTLTVQVDAPMTVARRRDPGTPPPTEPETIEPSAEFTMGGGDSAMFLPGATGEIRNAGEEEVVAWVVNLAVQPDAAGTPTP
jgi:hypothetical protein